MADWTGLCRGCLATGPQIALFDANSDIRTKFYESTTIEPHEEDGLPSNICHECLDIINTTHQFKKQCLRIDTELKIQLEELKKSEMQDSKGSESEKNNNEVVQKAVTSSLVDGFLDLESGNQEKFLIKQEPISLDSENDDDYYYVLVIDDDGKATPYMPEERVIKKEPEDIELNPVTGELEGENKDDFNKEVDTYINVDLSKNILEEKAEKLSTDDASSQDVSMTDLADKIDEDNSQEATIDSSNDSGSNKIKSILPGKLAMEPEQNDLLADQVAERNNIIQILTDADGNGESLLLKTSNEKGEEIVTYVTENELAAAAESESVMSQEEVIVCEGDDQFQIVNYDGSELVIEYTDEGQFATVIQQEDGTFLCECGVQFDDLGEYDKHQWSHHQSEHVCNLCGKGFESQEILTGHMLLHNQNGQHILCPFCDQWIKRNSLTQHIKYTHNQIKPQCSVCFKTFANPNNLKRHMLIHSGVKAFECDVCQRRFNQKITMQTHRLTHGQDPLVCVECDQIFPSKQAIQDHEAEHDVTECDKAAETLSVKQEIMTVEGETLAYACQLCHKMFSLESALRFHIENTHINDNMELLCAECGEVLPSRKAMYAHMYTHRQNKLKGIKRFICNTCGKSCASQAMLIMHERVHTNERPFPCQLCALRFKTKTHLRTHQLTHTREKKFGCSVCMKFFALKGNLVVHLRTHTGERPYVCSLCNDAFIDSKYLKKHKLRKHSIGNVPWNQY